MIVRINGVQIAMGTSVPKARNEVARPTPRPAVLRTTDWALEKLDEPMWRAAVTALAILTAPHIAWAASSAGGWKIIHMLQAGAFWIGLAVSIWGVYEWQIGGPGWKDRIMKGFLGYVLIMLLPMLFISVKEAMQ